MPPLKSVPARRIGPSEWELRSSPLYATGVAAEDVIRVTNHDTGEFEVLVRGGNACVQSYLGETAADDAEATVRAAREISTMVASLGGSVDAQTPG